MFIAHFFFTPLLFANTESGVSPFLPSGLSKQEKPKDQVELNSGPVRFKKDTSLDNRFNKASLLLLPSRIIDHNELGIMNLNQAKTTEPVKYVTLPGTLKPNQTPDFNSENEAFWKKAAAFLGLHSVPKIKEIGFIQNHSSNGAAVVTQVGKWHAPNNSKYVLNFDNGELIYFDLPLSSYSPENNDSKGRFIFNKPKFLFSNEGKVLLTKSTKNVIIDNSINKAGILEANHISVVDNRIILDIKEGSGSRFEHLNYINQAISSRSVQTRAQKSRNLLGIVWKPRKNTKNN